jgi:hypothetical protein
MTGRSLHDALLRTLTSARLRALVAARDVERLAAAVGAEEARTLCGTDRARLQGLARFLGRHFYRERIVRLFAVCRRLAQEAGRDPLVVLGAPEFRVLLDRAELGSAETAEAVAALVEDAVAPVLVARPWGPALGTYEGALFRVEAGPRGWRAGSDGAAVVRAPTARLVALDWDVTGLVAAVRRSERVLPEPRGVATRLLVALAPDGRVTTVRASEAIERVLAALDAPRSLAEIARVLGTEEHATRRLVVQLAEAGAVRWADGPASAVSLVG